MGWNPWNAFRTEVTEAKIIAVAQAMRHNGLAKAGYRYVDIDDGWWLKRNAQQEIVVRTSMFPSAVMPDGKTSLRPFVDNLHAMGFLAGLYTDIGRNACSQAWDSQSPNLPVGTVAEREVGSMDHQAADMRLIFGRWGFDLLKVDACGLADFGPDKAAVRNGTHRAFDPLIVRGQTTAAQTAAVKALYTSLLRQIETVRPDHDFALAVCTWGEAGVSEWGRQVGTTWRTSPDIEPTWASMLANFDSAAARPESAAPGHWSDPDLLELGNGEFGPDHLVEARSHLTLWALLSAPLILSSDLTTWSPELVAIAGNQEVIALDQDSLGKQAVVLDRAGTGEILAKDLSDGSKAIAFVNRGETPIKLSLPLSRLNLRGTVSTRDLWTARETTAAGALSIALAPRQTVVLRVSQKAQPNS